MGFISDGIFRYEEFCLLNRTKRSANLNTLNLNSKLYSHLERVRGEGGDGWGAWVVLV